MRLLFLALLAGCPGLNDSDTDADSDTDVDTGPPLSELPTDRCSNFDYDWVPLSDVGSVVSWERASELDISADTLRGMIALAGYSADYLPITYDVHMYRLRYRTQDRGQTVETTALLSFPDVEGEFPTVAWLHGTTGFMDECAPSGQGIEGAAGNLVLSSMGAVVVAPDYLGMNGFGPASTQVHPYMIAEATAVASLDSVRAAWSLAAELNEDAKALRQTVLFGGSEGGFAALWSERYAPWYLPSADIVGVAASVPPTDLVALGEHGAANFGPTTAALAAAMTTHKEWYGFEAPLSDVLTDEDPAFLASTLLETMNTECSLGSAADGLDAVDQIYTEAFLAAAAEDLPSLPEWGCAFENNSLVSAPFERISDTPVLYVISGDDQLVYHETNRADVPRLCEQGYDLEVIECEGASHTEGAVASLHLQWRWVQDRINGVPFSAPCALPEPIDCAATP